MKDFIKEINDNVTTKMGFDGKRFWIGCRSISSLERHTAVAKLEEMKSVFAIKEEEDELIGDLISPWQWVSFRCDNKLFKDMLIDVVISKHAKWGDSDAN
tara:strand:+ start:409 stop:708 length:300 start_codon:yes stop_codon:yes gene_type:complete